MRINWYDSQFGSVSENNSENLVNQASTTEKISITPPPADLNHVEQGFSSIEYSVEFSTAISKSLK